MDVNITKQGIWYGSNFSEYKNPVANILTSEPTTEADKARVYDDEHVEAVCFYEI